MFSTNIFLQIRKHFKKIILLGITVKEFCESNKNSGRSLISADYCQLEMRVLAHLSGDPNLINLLNDRNDFFEVMAEQWNSNGSLQFEVERETVKKVLPFFNCACNACSDH